jgi:hypothetical protein
MSDLREIFGEPISVYTRAQALTDGLLVEAGALAREAGFVVPVVLTRAAWVSCVAWPAGAGGSQSESGRLWDVLHLARIAVQQAEGVRDRLVFRVWRVPAAMPAARPEPVDLVVCIGPGDAGEPVITVLLQGED